MSSKLIVKDCECNEPGSVSQQCDDEGICSCKDEYTGDKCDSCARSTWDIASNCLKCNENFFKYSNETECEGKVMIW